MSGLAFHATPPRGEWLNDPNGLVHHEGQWRLFAQHRADGPAFAATGWARLSSPELLRWCFDGVAIPPDGERWAYSGSVLAGDDGLEAVHTLHEAGHEHQVRQISRDGGRSFAAAPLAMPAATAAANMRDPHVFGAPGDWWMLLANPCPWHGWEGALPSRLLILCSADGATWRLTGSIGPWHEPGVMWEVPALLQRDGRDLLLVSCIDRRGGGADCSVVAFAGTLDETGFARDPAWPQAGRRIDLGPDFYAAIPGSGVAPLLAWLGSWQTARRFPWPGFAGGPIALPRALALEGGRLVHGPWPGLANAFSRAVANVPVAGLGRAAFDGNQDFSLAIDGDGASAKVALAQAQLLVERRGPGLDWQHRHAEPLSLSPSRDLRLFVDGPAVELFLAPDGLAISLGVPADGPFAVSLTVAGRPAPIGWSTLAPG
jgi:sucrose-6-phosphate hydrolase SacC (GH32 family)